MSAKERTPLQQKVVEAVHALKITVSEIKELHQVSGYEELTDEQCEQILASVAATTVGPAEAILKSIQSLDLTDADSARVDEAKKAVFARMLGAWDSVQSQRKILMKALARKLPGKHKLSATELLDELKLRHGAMSLSTARTEVTNESYATLIDPTDSGNANLLIKQANGNLRYVTETKKWLHCAADRWQVDEHEVFANTAALEVGKHYLLLSEQAKARNKPELAEAYFRLARKNRNKAPIDAMLVQARKAPGVAISVTELDSSPWLLGVQNGVVDLQTGKLTTEAREDYVTRRCSVSYDPAAKCPRFEQFVEEITGEPIPVEYDADDEVIPGTVGRFRPRPELALYLQKALGYSATGTTREQKISIARGGGSNGKNLLLDAMKDVLGDYATLLPSGALMATARAADSERPTALAAGLAGARFVLSSETGANQKLDVNAVKAHTGEATMKARFLHKNPFEFKITHHIWLLTNNEPVIDHLDDAIRGRLHLVPFDRKWNRPGVTERNPALPDGDKTLKDQLKTEYEGILAWLVRGALMYQKEGLDPPAEVVASTKAYVQEQDHLGRWLATIHRCPAPEGARASVLFAEFHSWCASQDVEASQKSPKSFSNALKGLGIPWRDREDGRHYGLRSQAQVWDSDAAKPATAASAEPGPASTSTPTPVVRPEPTPLAVSSAGVAACGTATVWDDLPATERDAAPIAEPATDPTPTNGAANGVHIRTAGDLYAELLKPTHTEAQRRDLRKVADAFFVHFPTVESLAAAPLSKLQAIKGFHSTLPAAIQKLAKEVLARRTA